MLLCCHVDGKDEAAFMLCVCDTNHGPHLLAIGLIISHLTEMLCTLVDPDCEDCEICVPLRNSFEAFHHIDICSVIYSPNRCGRCRR